ncbi:uncharacterized protein LOC111630676 [Centruroides sculpturatus]|uniref:uncharacterized protein LOC111630669 n=1 Tax=Centruroides sculpturatus TaxID=218467 RepID=UPI000C6D64BA|nr:uncharacterized protein LOC111630669 [Centruroides sculpturatus]XP_023230582.1 uncharacterized protein LOC111630676 [Centruroides sculpturatus]
MRTVIVVTLLTLCCIWCQAIHPSSKNKLDKKHDFDVYLDALDSGEGHWLIRIDEEEKDIDTSGDEEITEFKLLPTPPLKRKDKNKKKKEVCCKLGRLAGDKGYICFADLYLARIIERNRNRAQSKMRLSTNENIKKSKEKVMRAFSRCVKGMKGVFNKCCYETSMKLDEKMKRI